MAGVFLEPEVCAALLLGAGGPLLGLARWAGRPRWLGAAFAGSLGLIAGTAYAAGQSPLVWLPAGGLGAAHVLAAAAGRYRETLLRLLASPRAAGALFIAAGPLLAAAWCAWYLHRTDDPPLDFSQPGWTTAAPELVSLHQSAYTDLGRPIPLFTRPTDETAAELSQAEAQFTGDRRLALIRLAAPNTASNCHGWIFLAGRATVRGEDVEAILADNGYRPADKPRAGNLVVYRNAGGRVAHTGVVRLVAHDRVLVESKWGYIGAYLHPITEQPYGDNFTVYRSDRPDHLLHTGPPHSDDVSVGR